MMKEKEQYQPGDKYVAYIGCYTRESIAGIHVLDVDMENGQLTEREQIRLDNPSHMCISHDGKHLYTTTDLGVAHLEIQEDGGLIWKETKWTGGIRGCYIFISRDDRWLFIGGYYDARITVMSLDENGNLVEVTEGIFHKGVGKNVTRRNTSPHVNCVRLTPDQKYLCAVDNGLDCVKVYRFHHDTGKLSLVDMIHLPLESAPRHMLFSKDGRFLYIICELENNVFVFSYNDAGKHPDFEQIQAISAVENAGTESAGSDLAMALDGSFLLCSHAGINEVSVFEINPESGLLDFKFRSAVSGEYPKTVKILPDCKHFVTLNHESGTVNGYILKQDMSCFLSCAKTVHLTSPNSIVFHKL